jgi:hypothetical protein
MVATDKGRRLAGVGTPHVASPNLQPHHGKLQMPQHVGKKPSHSVAPAGVLQQVDGVRAEARLILLRSLTLPKKILSLAPAARCLLVIAHWEDQAIGA